MVKIKSKKKVSDKMIGIMIGIAITLSAIGIISAVSVSYAHRAASNTMDGSDMMSGNMMPMMKQHEMTQEEINEMLKSMDKDGDGQCDYCSMSIEMCRKMMNS